MFSSEGRLEEYVKAIKEHQIKEVYTGIILYMRGLRADAQRTLKTCVVGSLYEGLLDMTYFPITNESLRKTGLKLAVVFVHEKGSLELWISGRNRKVMNEYQGVFSCEIFQGHHPYHEKKNQDALLEMILSETMDLYENPENYEKIIGTITEILGIVESQRIQKV